MALTAACGSGSAPRSVKGPATGPAPTVAASVGYSVWPEAECDARHTSNSGERGPTTSHVRWKLRLGSATSQGPSIGADATIYDADDAGTLYAVDPATGTVKWTFNGGGTVAGDVSTTPAVLPDGTVVWPGPRDTVFGLSPAGRELWSVNVGSMPLSPVIASPDSFYLMTMGGVLSAIQITADHAAPRWTLPLGKVSYGSPVIRADGVVETTVDNSLVAVRDQGSSAKELWRFTTTHPVEVSPAVNATGVTVLGSNDGVEYGVDSAGKQVWTRPVGGYSYSSAAVTKTGAAYFGDNHGTLTVADASTGQIRARLRAGPGNIWTAPLIDSVGDIYYGTNDGHIYGFSATGNQMFDLNTGKTVSSYPAMTATGDLLIGSADGYLYSIGA